MMDNEIIKTLEFIVATRDDTRRATSLIKGCLDLINRYKEEIDWLEECQRRDCNMILSLNHELLNVKEKVINEFSEKLLALKIKPEFPWDDFYVTEDAIHSIKKEMMEKLEENNNER